MLNKQKKLGDYGKELCASKSGYIFASSRCYVRDRLGATKHQACFYTSKEGIQTYQQTKYEQKKCFLVDQPVPITRRELIGPGEERVAEL